MTESEKLMWSVLRNRQFKNLKFRRQHLIDGYLVDFYCHDLRIVIEIDGKIHNGIEQINNDIARQKIIKKSNIRFFRAKSEDVEFNNREVLSRLEIFINNLDDSK